MMSIVRGTLCGLLVLGLAGCYPGPATQSLMTLWRQFADSGCQGSPPAERPECPASNCSGQTPCASGPIRVMTYNVMCSVCMDDEHDNWFARVPHLRDTMARYAPDLMGLQELSTAFSLADVLPADGAYGALTFAAGCFSYGDSTILYRKSRFEVLDSGRFWLGVLPCHTSLPGWRPSMPRYLYWARMLEKDTGFEFLFICSHFDAASINRGQSAHVVTEWLAPIVDKIPIVFVGDFNSEPNSESYATLKGGNGAPMAFENVYDHAAQRTVARNTGEGDLDVTGDPEYAARVKIIDHILFAGPIDVAVSGWYRDTYTYGPNAFPASDHFPIIADIQMTLK
ncbi:MAG: Endo/exonuclease/phosphatase protein [Candidatus Hydrogenedentes bacterium]|nr:Endo/exonuclease/phosphatase protein [Candidatus Hydrogenedentota bacterium]